MLLSQMFECKFPSELHHPGPIGILNRVLAARAAERWVDQEVIGGREQGLQEDQNCCVTPTVFYVQRSYSSTKVLEPFSDVAAFELMEIPVTNPEVSYVGEEPKDFQVRSVLFQTNWNPVYDEAAHVGKGNGLSFRRNGISGPGDFGVGFYKGDEVVPVA